MTSKATIGRRDVLGAALGGTLGALFPAAPFQGAARAAGSDAAPLSFQLSWIKSIQYGGYFAAIEQGFFKKHGVDPTFNPGGPNVDAVANVASGLSPIGDRITGPLVLAREKGFPIKIIATVFQKSPTAIMSPAGKPIRAVRELAGKTIASPLSSRPILLNLLRDAGVDPRSVTIVPASPDPTGLVSGQLDAYIGYSTNQGVMLQTRGFEIVALNVHDLGVPETAGTIYAREDFLKDNRDLTVRFLRGAIEGWRWALERPETTAKLMVEKYGSPGLNYDAQLAEIRASTSHIMARVGTEKLLSIDLDQFATVIDQYRRAEIVKSDLKATDLCDPSFIDAALAA
ncbi:ABC transporter substrate-binding protein [Rhodoplanes roseus]|uniref:Thiamine pyrimidine synthase n=1 Tax=Rhodoplanes roseus TaxID=29409 RepID=A0A327KX21_9BRAD|nr:ABC transporter substrate-binding protein [Rhodoplanes roseus]RAI42574.1 hypothetical protein CH341_18875 [Rhodoplanes roseus]